MAKHTQGMTKLPQAPEQKKLSSTSQAHLQTLNNTSKGAMNNA
jgi:hypothetical protein